MLFSSLEFIFIFLPIVFGGYFTCNYFGKYNLSRLFLVFASLFFYAYWNVAYLPLLLGSITFNYLISGMMQRFRKFSKIFLIFALIFNIGLLCYFKYMDFFIENINFILGKNFNLLHIVLPLGISFFTITQIAYLVDCHEGLVRERNLINYALFVTFFPHLIAGPILHHKQMMPQFSDLEKKKINYENIAKGIYIFAIGLFKKVAIADVFGEWANAGFSLVDSGGALNFSESWACVLSYAFQLYFDFSGYCDMAIGLGLLFNITLPVNFNSPFKATNIIDFWKRWHISLTNFITTYIYTPIIRSFNKPSFGKILIATFIAFVIAGVWHGSGWNFFIFGCIHGIALVINHFWQKKIKRKMPKFLGWILMMLTILIAWVFFRAQSLKGAMMMLKGIFGLNGIALPSFLEKYLIHFVGSHISFGYMFGKVLERGGAAGYSIIYYIFLGFIIVLCTKNSIQLKDNLKPSYFNIGFMVFLSLTYLAHLNEAKQFLYFNF